MQSQNHSDIDNQTCNGQIHSKTTLGLGTPSIMSGNKARRKSLWNKSNLTKSEKSTCEYMTNLVPGPVCISALTENLITLVNNDWHRWTLGFQPPPRLRKGIRSTTFRLEPIIIPIWQYANSLLQVCNKVCSKGSFTGACIYNSKMCVPWLAGIKEAGKIGNTRPHHRENHTTTFRFDLNGNGTLMLTHIAYTTRFVCSVMLAWSVQAANSTAIIDIDKDWEPLPVHLIHDDGYWKKGPK